MIVIGRLHHIQQQMIVTGKEQNATEISQLHF